MREPLREEIHNKLVRDKVPENIIAFGNEPQTRRASEEEYTAELIEKLGEEFREFSEERSLSELADIYDVILSLVSLLEGKKGEFEEVRKKKLDRYGLFEKRIILEKTKIFNDYSSKNR